MIFVLGLVNGAEAQLTLGGDPRIDPADFRITVFASGLDFPSGLTRLPDGSLLVALSPPTGGSFFSSGGRLVRLVDADEDGVADGPGTIVFDDPMAGTLTSLRVAGTLVFVTSAANGAERISILRMAGGPAGPYTRIGTLDFAFPPGWEHTTYGLAVRRAPGTAADTWELYFNVGSSSNDAQSAATVGLGGLLTGTLEGASIYRVVVEDTGTGVAVSALTRVASGVRNAAAMGFHPDTGDLYFADNGIDTPSNRPEPLSADELNRIADAGVGVPHFGFPTDYVAYRTGQRVGSGGVQPLVAFQPIPMPDGAESEGAAGLAFAPAGFPIGLAHGVFVGFHGQSSLGGLENEENPVVFHDFDRGGYFHFIAGRQTGMG
ncbi:MAG: PQQ-dependent sugar dehydrogenase, partial [Candidatus Rokuibacteriota bacterium]